jgi:hypothetical protein
VQTTKKRLEMKKFLLAASSVLAVALPGAAQAQTHYPRMCDKTFTVAMAKKAANANWRGTRVPAVVDRHHMYKYMVCQRNPYARDFVAWFYRHAKSLNHARRHPVVAVEAAAPGLSGHAQCIIQHESGGNSQAVNGQYEGIGQWSPDAWAEDGGHRFASTPLGASLAEQEIVLMGEGDARMSQQQGQYDGCG